MNDQAEHGGEDRYAVARSVLAELTCPVVIVAAAADGHRSCATGTAMYVSFVPPKLVIAVHPGSTTCRLIEASGEFSVSLLSDDQLDAAGVGGRSSKAGVDKLESLGLGVTTSPESGAPAVARSTLNAWCRVTHRHEAGDHVVFIGSIVDHRLADGPASPLLRQRRRYVRQGEWLTEAEPGGYPT
jgi:flavin reductase (DIM6/NTAB) family NADH-FMN oxidoreductase RutF